MTQLCFCVQFVSVYIMYELLSSQKVKLVNFFKVVVKLAKIVSKCVVVRLTSWTHKNGRVI